MHKKIIDETLLHGNRRRSGRENNKHIFETSRLAPYAKLNYLTANPDLHGIIKYGEEEITVKSKRTADVRKTAKPSSNAIRHCINHYHPQINNCILLDQRDTYSVYI